MRLIGAVLLGIVAILFANGNQAEVAVTFPGGWFLVEVPLFVVVFIPLLLGFLLGVTSGWPGGVRPYWNMQSLRDRNQALEREVTNLRTLPLINDL